ncbi:MAG: S-layer homology domain-containing protein [bacterium]
MRALRALLVVLVATQVLVMAETSAYAQVTDTVPCPVGIPDAGFVDVDSTNVHKHDIDCISYWGITTQVGTYDGAGSVTREQMALFLTRAYNWVGNLPPGNPRGFEDVAGLSVESQVAINQLGELSITTGVSATAFAPQATVTREQMARFLARTIRATAVDLPDGSAQGFNDINAWPTESQQAINQMRQLGVTLGTTATTFEPGATVNRQQMASFLARTLAVIWTFRLFTEFELTCNPPLVEEAGNGVHRLRFLAGWSHLQGP